MATSGASGSSSISQSPSAIFDPPVVTVTDKLTAIYVKDGDTRTKPMLNNYIRHARVGGGQHGEVFLCFRLDSKLPADDPRRLMPVAMKSVKRNNPKAERFKKLQQKSRLPTNRDPNHLPLGDKLNTTEQKIRKEIAIMKKLRHPHVVRLYEVIDDSLRDKIYMIMEYLGGGEVKWRNDDNEPVLTVAQTRRIIRDAVLGLEYLHYQGIIHRDIKPANLLWTGDRSQVKIGDFGVSHFSYAQRLAAAGKAAENELPEAILMDDSDLSKRAGTPSFLAPEVIWEYSTSSPLTSQTELSSARSTGTLQSLPSQPRPPVTKSIDIWALGVTLYCLLFGKVPFTPFSENGGEFELYRVICNSDWSAASTMGADEVRTGGRHPRPTEPGAAAILLLDRFLQKDYKTRITLDEVKLLLGDDSQANPWILEDLPDPERWIHATSAVAKIKITAGEASDAMSTVRFRWNWGARVTRRLSNFFSKPRLPATTRAPAPLSDIGEASSSSRRSAGVRSVPHGSAGGGETSSRATAVSLSSPSRIRPRVDTNQLYHVSSSPGLFPSRPSEKKDKGKKREDSLGPAHHHHHHHHSHGGPSREVPVKKRQGSEQTDPSTTTPSTSSSSPMVLSQLKSWFPIFNNRSSERTNHQVEFALSQDRNNKRPAAAGRQQQPQLQQRSGTAPNPTRNSTRANDPGSRRSEEALRYYRSEQHSESSDGMLTAARRASSWGQGDEPLEFAEVMSVTSMDLQLTDNDYLFGVGGIEPRSYRPRPRQPPPSPPEDHDDDSGSSPLCSPTSSSSFNPASPREGEPGPSNYADIAEQQRDGVYVFDGSSSSIVSGYGNVGESKWVNTLSDDDDSDDDEFYDGEDDPEFDGQHHRPRGEMDSFDEGVTFSPRRRPLDDDDFTNTPQ